jgi:hypothetical protein
MYMTFVGIPQGQTMIIGLISILPDSDSFDWMKYCVGLIYENTVPKH